MLRDKIMRKRYGLARSLERSAVPERPYVGRGPRYLVQPDVRAACAPSLLAIAAALRHDPLALDEDGLRAVRSFISDGVRSPFFGRNATAAMREAVRLQHLVVGTRTGVTPADRRQGHRTRGVAIAVVAVAAISVVLGAGQGMTDKSPGSSVSHAGRSGSASTLLTHREDGSSATQCPCNVGLPASRIGGSEHTATLQTEGVPSSRCPSTSASPIEVGRSTNRTRLKPGQQSPMRGARIGGPLA